MAGVEEERVSTEVGEETSTVSTSTTSTNQSTTADSELATFKKVAAQGKYNNCTLNFG